MKVSIIIPYNIDRGWLKEAIASAQKQDCQLILSQGEGNWPQNFNKALAEAKGEYIRYLHEDDKLTPNCIVDSVKTFEEQNCDFIHGNAMELYSDIEVIKFWKPKILYPTLLDMLDFKRRITTMHSVTLMFKRELFDKLGGFNESPKMYSFEEFEFILRCLSNGAKPGYCNSFLGIYRRHNKQIIRTVGTDRIKNRQELINQYK